MIETLILISGGLLLICVFLISIIILLKKKENVLAYDYVDLLLKQGRKKQDNNNEINPNNECSHLYEDIEIPKDLSNPLKEIWDKQTLFQSKYANFNEEMSLKNRINFIDKNWRNLCIEYGELMQRLPYKEWKRYKNIDFNLSKKYMLEIFYEYADMAHFFVTIGIYLGIDWKTFYNLYITKNKENFNRQKRKEYKGE